MASRSTTTDPRGCEYALGHTSRELDRLTLQARVLEPCTRRLLRDAGIAPGMRVLDVGCGAGDVSFLAADIVGAAGEVVGADKAEPALARARERAERNGAGNVRFVRAELSDIDLDRRFDAVVGRLVLMYLPDPAAALRALARLVEPGGVMAFHELDIGAVRALPEVPQVSRVIDWVGGAFRAAGAELRMGMKLHSAFVSAGLPPPAMSLDGFLGGGPDFVGYEMIADLVRSLLPLIEKAGIASPEEIDVDRLAQRIRDEVAERRSTLVIPELVGAWARKPGAS